MWPQAGTEPFFPFIYFIKITLSFFFRVIILDAGCLPFLNCCSNHGCLLKLHILVFVRVPSLFVATSGNNLEFRICFYGKASGATPCVCNFLWLVASYLPNKSAMDLSFVAWHFALVKIFSVCLLDINIGRLPSDASFNSQVS